MVTAGRLETLRALADPTRRQIAELLSGGALAVSELASGFPMSRPAVSKHLRVMREHGLVVERREGRRRIYELAAEPLEEIVAWLESLAGAEGTRRGLGPAPSGRNVRSDRRAAAPAQRPADATTAQEEPEGQWRSW